MTDEQLSTHATINERLGNDKDKNMAKLAKVETNGLRAKDKGYLHTKDTEDMMIWKLNSAHWICLPFNINYQL